MAQDFSGGNVAGNVLPDATGRDLGSATQRWDVNAQNVDITGAVTTTGSMEVASLGVGNPVQSPNYILDVGNPGGKTCVRIGPANADSGGYLTSTVSNNLTLTSGSAYNGTNWVAKAADIAQVHIGNNQIEFHTDQGLTPGATFTPTIRMHISGSQVTFRAGSAAVPCISNYEEEPNAVDGFWFPTNQVGVTIGGTGRVSFSSSTLAPITTLAYSLGSSSLNFLSGFFRNVICRNFADNADITLLQKDVTNDDVYLSNGNARDVYVTAGAGRKVFFSNNIFTSAKITTYNNITTVSGGIPSEIATVDLTAQAAAIGATTLYAVPADGMYRISYVAAITRAGSVSSTLGGANGVQIVYTDPADSVAKTSPAGPTSAANTTATMVSGSVIVYAKSGTNIQYQIGYTDGGGTVMQYSLHLKCEAL